MTYIAATVQGSTLYQVLEPLQCSLRSYLPHWRDEFDSNKVNKVVEVMKCVVSGLRYLHDKRFVHFDLSMDTVAVCIVSASINLNYYSWESISFLRR